MLIENLRVVAHAVAAFQLVLETILLGKVRKERMVNRVKAGSLIQPLLVKMANRIYLQKNKLCLYRNGSEKIVNGNPSLELYLDRFTGKDSFLDQFILNRKNDFKDYDSQIALQSSAEDGNSDIVSNPKLFEILENSIEIPSADQNLQSLPLIFKKRHSTRKFKQRPLALQDIGNITSALRVQKDGFKRSYPSAGGLFPINVYFYLKDLKDISNGVYKYQAGSNSLLKLSNSKAIDFKELFEISNFQTTKGINIAVLLVDYRLKNEIKYGDRGFVFGLLEAGAVMQNIELVCTAYDYGICQLGGYDLSKNEEMLEINGKSECIVGAAVIG